MVAPSSYVRVSGAYKRITNMHVHVGGTWKQVTNAYVRAGGVWKKIHASGGNDQFTKILLHMEGANNGTTFTDDNAGGSAHTWTAPGSFGLTSTTTFKFGTSSMWGIFPGAGGYIITPNHADFALGSGDWTVDFWFNRSGNSGARNFFGQLHASSGSAADNVVGGQFNSSNRILGFASVGGTLHMLTSANAYNDSTWRHFALIRSGNTVTMYVNGVVEASAGVSGSVPAPNLSWGVGRAGNNTTQADYQGYIDEFRLSVGVARWTAPFTPPTVAYF